MVIEQVILLTDDLQVIAYQNFRTIYIPMKCSGRL